MSLIQAKKNIDILIRYGNGEKAMEVRQWHNKEQAELVEQHMVTVIVCTRLLYMLTRWKNILIPKYANCHWTQFFFK